MSFIDDILFIKNSIEVSAEENRVKRELDEQHANEIWSSGGTIFSSGTNHTLVTQRSYVPDPGVYSKSELHNYISLPNTEDLVFQIAIERYISSGKIIVINKNSYNEYSINSEDSIENIKIEDVPKGQIISREELKIAYKEKFNLPNDGLFNNQVERDIFDGILIVVESGDGNYYMSVEEYKRLGIDNHLTKNENGGNSTSYDDIKGKLIQLKELYELELITEDEYKNKKNQLLDLL